MKITLLIKKYTALMLALLCLILSACGAPVDDGGEPSGDSANEGEQGDQSAPTGGEPVADVFEDGDVVDTTRAEYTYEDMESDLRELEAKYPELIRVSSAGKSLDGREIYYADMGDAAAERSIMINAGIHGREYMTPLVLMKQLEYYLVNYQKRDGEGVTFAQRFEGILFRIVPMINPDGITLSQKGLAGLRSAELREGVEAIYRSDCQLFESYKEYESIDEYLKYWKANAGGVDLNRNFDIDYWEEMRTGISAPSSQKYKGDRPNSEPETAALCFLTMSMPGLMCALSIHSQGEIIYWDCGQTGELRNATRNLALAVAKISGYSLYGKFETPDATYNDWCTLNLGVPSINIETGVDKCPLPIEQYATIRSQTARLWETVVDFYRSEG